MFRRTSLPIPSGIGTGLPVRAVPPSVPPPNGPAGAGEESERQRLALTFTVLVLVSALFLQRFGLPAGGGKSISIVGPLGLGLVAWGMWKGALVLDRARTFTFIALVICVLLGVAWNVATVSVFANQLNLLSLGQFIVLTSFAIFTFAEPVDERRFFRAVNQVFGIIAIAGIAQFMAQLAGIQVFSFTGLLPDSILFEFNYNLEISAGVGNLLKSNGFFLLEPSIYSQIMALGLILEMLSFRRKAYIGLFATGLMLSFSGTGWIVLGSFILLAAIGMGWRGIVMALSVAMLIAIAVGAVMLISPDLGEIFQARMGEFSEPSTSGHLRFITPFWLLSDVLAEYPSAALLGIGSGASEHLTMPYDYNVNTPVKVAVEYGMPALVAYVLLFILGRKSPMQGPVVGPAVVLFMFTGGYQQFPPILFITLLLTVVARLRPEAPETA